MINDMASPQLDIGAGAVADATGNRIVQATARVAVTDGIPPVLASSSYNTGTGVLIIAFSEPLGPTIHYDPHRRPGCRPVLRRPLAG